MRLSFVRRLVVSVLVLWGTIAALGPLVHAQVDSTEATSPRIQLQPENYPPAALDTSETINVRNADLRDVLRGLGEQYDLNLIVDNAIQERVTVRLSNLPVIEVVRFMAEQYDLRLVQTGSIFRVEAPEPKPTPQTPPNVRVSEDGLLTVDLSGDTVEAIVREVTQQSDVNVIVQDGGNGSISGYLEDVPLVQGLRTLFENNGYILRNREGIYVVTRPSMRPSEEGGGRRRSLWVNVANGRVDLEARDAPIGAILDEVATQLELNLVTYDVPQGRLSVMVEGLTPEETLDLLFKGTNVTYRKEGETFYVGSRETSGIAKTKLIRLNHMKAEGIPEMLPGSMQQQATVQVVPEHNALMVTGTNDVLREIESAVSALDAPTPVILIEALVVDFRTTDRFEFGAEFGQDSERSQQAAEEGYTFDDDGFQGEVDDQTGNRALDALRPFLRGAGIRNIGRLPDDFFLQLRALSQEGAIEIRSRPQVSTLSGHTASLRVGTTQYFILRKETPIQSPNGGVVIQETERFERIEANVSLEITPWVTASGEVTTQIRPEFSTPVGSFNSEVPPTISSRVFESTVRLREGETIILGGLIRDEKDVNVNKVPILGDIPWIGNLFGNRTRNVEKSELVIYLTPRIFYGDRTEAQDWQDLQDELDLPPPREDE